MTPGPYNLISLGTLLLLSYFLSLFLVRNKLLALQRHRKIWNTLLAVFFLSTTLLGLLLAVKANYKLSIDWAGEAKQWHVDSGIGFAFVAIFHLIWHFRYYFRTESAPSELNTQSFDTTSSNLSFSSLEHRSFFMLLGYISIMAQVVLLREFIKSFHGNELVIGVFLAVWMIITALGAKLGSTYKLRLSRGRLSLLLSLLAFIPLLIYLLLILAVRFLFLPGFSAPLLDTSIVLLVLTSLFTGISGFLFGYVSNAVRQNGSGASAYRLDSIGSVAGGLVFGLVLVHLLNNIQLLTFLFLSICLTIALIFRTPARVEWRISIALFAALLFAGSMVPQLRNGLEELRFKGEKILDARDTPYGNLSFTTRNEQVNAYLDGNLVFNSSDLVRTEESVHFPALQHPNPRSFLILGGGSSAYLSEVEKYHPQRSDYCEVNPWIYKQEQLYISNQKSNAFNFISKDGRSWLNNSGDLHYDIVISTASNPITLGLNRYFTFEFYSLVNEHLAPGGIFCMRLSTSDNYVDEEGIDLLATNMKTLKEVFPHVLVVPGSSIYFLASDHPLSLDFPSLLNDRNISTTYVHPDYLNAVHITFDSDQLTGQIETQEADLNSDLRPQLFFSSLRGIESRTGTHSLIITGILTALLFLLFLFRYSPRKRAMYITGFTGAGIQIILILVMQSFYGFAYLVAPMMITLFMAGIVVGTFISFKVWASSISSLAAPIGLMALLSIAAIFLLGSDNLYNSQWPGQLILGLLNLLPGILVGWEYSIGVTNSGKYFPGTPGILYSADLIGAALGTLLPALFLLPLIGVINTFKLFFCINLLAALSLLVTGINKKGNG